MPVIVMLCGSNGAGKSTFYRLRLASLGLSFVNADEIAKDIYGPDAERMSYDAAKMAEERRQELVGLRESFIFETVLSDPVGAKVEFIRQCNELGYHTRVHFIGIDSPELSAARVAGRVARGGHDVPLDKIQSRYARTLENLRRLCDRSGKLVIHDNSNLLQPYRVIAVLEKSYLTALSPQLPPWCDGLDLPARATARTATLPH